MSIRGASGRRSIGASEHQPAEHQAGGGALEQAAAAGASAKRWNISESDG